MLLGHVTLCEHIFAKPNMFQLWVACLLCRQTDGKYRAECVDSVTCTKQKEFVNY